MAPERRTLAHHPEAAPVVEGDHRVEPAPAFVGSIPIGGRIVR